MPGTSKAFLKTLGCTFVLIGGILSGFAAETDSEPNQTAPGAAVDPVLVRFVGEKRAFAKTIEKKYELKAPSVVWKFFDAAEKGDWLSTGNYFNALQAGSGRYGNAASIPTQIWPSIHEVYGACEQFHTWDPRLLRKWANGIVESIPSGSIYFGGTDGGRFLISAFSKSHTEGRPFFTVTQNALVDGNYLAYLREIYTGKINIPNSDDSAKAFQDYIKDVQERFEKKQLKPGENVSTNNGRVQVSGATAVMMVNERIAKMFIEKNPEREVYMEESYAFESFYPHLTPHGLIFKVSHDSMDRLATGAIERDHQFWTDQVHSLLGNVVDEKTTVPQLCSWAEKIYLRHDFTDFAGNRAFCQDQQAPQFFAKGRSAIASLYEWRGRRMDQKPEASALIKEADFAYRQAVALSPFSPEAVWRYSEFLLNENRTNDAKILIQTTLKMDPEKWKELDAAYFTTALDKLRDKAKELRLNNER